MIGLLISTILAQELTANDRCAEQLIADLVTLRLDTKNPCSLNDLCREPAFYSSTFEPAQGFKEPNTLHPAMKQLVRMGVKALPRLLAHVDDKTKTAFELKHEGGMGGILTANEYQARAYVRNQRVSFPRAEIPGISSTWFDPPESYTVTIGDLCFDAIGQIVNRYLSPMRPQPTNCIMISSPAACPALAQAVRKDWAGLTKEAHRQQLEQDVYAEVNSMDCNAIKRLIFFYPKEGEALAVRMLDRPLFDFELLDKNFDAIRRTKKPSEWRALYHRAILQCGAEAAATMAPRLYYEEIEDVWNPAPTEQERQRMKDIRTTLFPRWSPTHDRLYAATEIYDQPLLLGAVRRFKSPLIDAAIHRLFLRAVAQPLGPGRRLKPNERAGMAPTIDEIAIRSYLRIRGKGHDKEYLRYFRNRVAKMKPKYGQDVANLALMKKFVKGSPV